MRTIRERLLWLSTSKEYHSEYAYVERLKNIFKNETLPLWQDVLINGSAENIYELLTEIQLLDTDYQIEILQFHSQTNIKFTDYLAENADVNGLELFFSIIKNFPEEIQLDLFFNYANSSNEDFFSKISENKSSKNTLLPFLNYISSLPLSLQIKFYQANITTGVAFPLHIAEKKRSIIDNQFRTFVDAWSKLVDNFKSENRNLTLENIYYEILETKIDIKSFYELMCQNQTPEDIFYFISHGLVPDSHMKYFNKVRDDTWDVIIRRPLEERRDISSDLVFYQGPFSPMFCNFHGLLNLHAKIKWQKKISKLDDEMQKTENSKAATGTSYGMVSMVTATLLSDDGNVYNPAPSAPRYVEENSVSKEIKNMESFEEIPLEDDNQGLLEKNRVSHSSCFS